MKLIRILKSCVTAGFLAFSLLATYSLSGIEIGTYTIISTENEIFLLNMELGLVGDIFFMIRQERVSGLLITLFVKEKGSAYSIDPYGKSIEPKNPMPKK